MITFIAISIIMNHESSRNIGFFETLRRVFHVSTSHCCVLLWFARLDQVFRIPTKWRSRRPSHALVSTELQYYFIEISSATAQDLLEKHLIQSCINKVVSLTHQHPSTPSTLHISQSLRMQQWPSLVAFQSHLGRLTIHPFHKPKPTWLFQVLYGSWIWLLFQTALNLPGWDDYLKARLASKAAILDNGQ